MCAERIKLLESLNLFANKLETLPATFGNLVLLKKLVLHKNQIRGNRLLSCDLSTDSATALPDSIGNLKHLQVLCVSVSLPGRSTKYAQDAGR